MASDRAHDIRGGCSGATVRQGDARFGEHELQLVFETLLQSSQPLGAAVFGVCVINDDVYGVLLHRHREAAHIVCERVQGTTTLQVETSVVPVACEQSIADSAAAQGKAHVWAPVVDREEAPCVGEHRDVVAGGTDDRASTLLKLCDRSHPNSFGSDDAHCPLLAPTIHPRLGECAAMVGGCT